MDGMETHSDNKVECILRRDPCFGKMHVLEKVQCCTQDNPFYAVFVALTERLPNRLLLCSFSSDADACAASVGAWRVLLDLAEFDALRWDVVPSIGEVEHAPKLRVWVGLGYLKQRKIAGVWRGKRKLVDGCEDTGVGNGPFQVTRGLAADNLRG